MADRADIADMADMADMAECQNASLRAGPGSQGDSWLGAGTREEGGFM